MTVLLVDGDLGFIVWLSQLLANDGHVVIPAAHPENACNLLDAIGASIDVLIVDSAFPDAKELADSLRASDARVQVMALVESDEQREKLLPFWRADGYCHRPSRFDNHTDRYWLDLIQPAERVEPAHAAVV